MVAQIRYERIDRLTPSLFDSIKGTFPEDDLREKRAANLQKAIYILVAKNGPAVIGVLFIRRLLGLPNATWIVKEDYQRQGIGCTLLQEVQKDRRFITARCRNQASRKLAGKSGFIIFPLGIAFWRKQS